MSLLLFMSAPLSNTLYLHKCYKIVRDIVECG